jgi:hypothetical protein
MPLYLGPKDSGFGSEVNAEHDAAQARVNANVSQEWRRDFLQAIFSACRLRYLIAS